MDSILKWVNKSKVKLTKCKSRKQIMASSILPKNEQNSLSWAPSVIRMVSFVCFWENRGHHSICFRNLLTFRYIPAGKCIPLMTVSGHLQSAYMYYVCTIWTIYKVPERLIILSRSKRFVSFIESPHCRLVGYYKC